MIFDFDEQAGGLKIRDDRLTRIKAIHPTVFFWRQIVDARVIQQDVDHRQVVTLAHFIVIKVVSRCDFYTARSEFWINIVVGDDRDFTIDQG